MKTKPRFLSIFGGLILILTGFLLGLSVATTNPAIKLDSLPAFAGTKGRGNDNGISSPRQTASVLIDTGRDILGFQNLSIQSGDTVFSLLTRLDASQESLTVTSKDYKDLGVMIESINNFKNSEGGNYWQYWVNNEYAQAASDKHLVKPGDVVMWKFTASQFKEY